MASEASDRMMTLLQELSTLKQFDQQSDAMPSGSEKKDRSEKEEQRLRQQRHEEITEEMKSLAEQKKSSESSS